MHLEQGHDMVIGFKSNQILTSTTEQSCTLEITGNRNTERPKNQSKAVAISKISLEVIKTFDTYLSSLCESLISGANFCDKVGNIRVGR